ncbi:hypothetical protein Misp06_01640 [Microbulbifer sp. NBRC 101763]|uniref:hypothetical protein n=1 Tax=unclassified Microbulbifer TaxID=2619833 RepID=UPI0024ADC397|nr:hypothetical protein [Microbulbifer sp. MLAF003]WHI51993.1 hypothetical protein P3339_03975 [Microbulbifer sp. MLAF003]
MNWNRKQPNPTLQTQSAPGFFQLMVAAQSLSISLVRETKQQESPSAANTGIGLNACKVGGQS